MPLEGSDLPRVFFCLLCGSGGLFLIFDLFFHKMVQSALEGMEHELLGMYGGECMMRNIPDLSGKIEKMFFLWRGRDRRCGKFPNLSGA